MFLVSFVLKSPLKRKGVPEEIFTMAGSRPFLIWVGYTCTGLIRFAKGLLVRKPTDFLTKRRRSGTGDIRPSFHQDPSSVRTLCSVEAIASK